MKYPFLALLIFLLILYNLRRSFKQYSSGISISEMDIEDIDVSNEDLLKFQLKFYIFMNVIWIILLMLLTFDLIAPVVVCIISSGVWLLSKPMFKKLCKYKLSKK